ncbi:hypothetical protein [Streptomyces sp. XY332]|uniref:hypothetical protein n=1 Tax=Streptomyces sp. XY332 TaxID=1415561 RepID=UPI0006B20508|nr:hypothetical protein [Streptomyces sp. XY332]KOY50376.1 hypothetical protein ADK59_37355 [Streptomyces sp. XY332]
MRVSIEAQGIDAYVKVLTTTGRVYQLHVGIEGQSFDPDTEQGWVLQNTTPTLRRGSGVDPFRGDLSYGFSPNRTE